ncbi:hypothetical protein JA1_000709 [Spathaspora sp. JA1]|nr:hypothetical protein JA1_000709 [Spathaspora sp. JA1]
MKRSINDLSGATILNEHKRHTLQPHRSMLDLMDDTRLTSLPLPPPPPKRAGSSSSASTPNSMLSLEKKLQQSGDNIDKISVNAEDCTNEDDYDEYEDESQDPIVLVEDYMKNSPMLPHMLRQKSLANFKSRILSDCISESTSFIEQSQTQAYQTQRHLNNEVIYDQDILDSPSSTTPRNSISEETARFTNRKEDKEDLEAIFGRIPGSDLLKYCDLCEKPLYEISSIINNNNHTQRTGKRNHHEFICSDCIENYETFINEFYDSDEEEQLGLEKSRKKLLHIFHSIQYKYNLNDEGSSSKKKKISTNLIERLHLIQSSNIGK